MWGSSFIVCFKRKMCSVFFPNFCCFIVIVYLKVFSVDTMHKTGGTMLKTGVQCSNRGYNAQTEGTMLKTGGTMLKTGVQCSNRGYNAQTEGTMLKTGGTMLKQGVQCSNKGYNAQNRGTMLKQGVQCSTRRVQCLKQRVQYSKHSSNRWVQCLKQRVQIFVRISQNFAKNAKTKRNRKKKICEKYICEYNFRELFNS